MKTTYLHLPSIPPFELSAIDLHVNIGHHPILRGVDFNIAGGQVIAIVGRNGSGKTTLLRTLSGLQLYKGDVHTTPHQPIDLAMVFQNPDLQLFNSTVQQEILYKVPDPDMVIFSQVMGMLGLDKYLTAQPLLLSEGEKKRVAMATAIMRMPRHGILLDEPSLGQDISHKIRLMQLARAIAGTGRLVMMTTHDLTLASHADYMLMLNDGRIVGEGIPGDLFKQKARWADIGMPVPKWVLESIDA